MPDSAVILGGGPVGIELTQMLCRFGCTVEIVEQTDRLLAREDGRVSELIEDALKHDGIRVHTGAELENVALAGERRTVALQAGDQLGASRVIVANPDQPIGGVRPGPRAIDRAGRCELRGLYGPPRPRAVRKPGDRAPTTDPDGCRRLTRRSTARH